jgi:hypothetical protein
MPFQPRKKAMAKDRRDLQEKKQSPENVEARARSTDGRTRAP